MTDAGLAYFKDCKNLKTLGLNTHAGERRGISQLKDCKDLKYLILAQRR